MQAITQYLHTIAHNHLVIAVSLCVALDTILGCLRAIKEHIFNSSFGIDGAIRKAAIMVSVLFLMLADALIGMNFIGFINADIRQVLGVRKLGLGEFFCILYILYEAVSIMKNWALIGLPFPQWMRNWLEKTLGEMKSDKTPGGKPDVGTD